MKLSWLGHSCFLLESNGFRLLTDPYHDVPGLSDIQMEADAVYCSHQHFDHAHLAGVHLLHGKDTPFSIRKIETCHDHEGGDLRGKNTVHCFRAEGLTVVHLGDLGHLLSPEQIHAIGPCDVLLIPIGGVFTIDSAEAKTIVDALSPSVVVPMHYRLGKIDFPELSTADEFISRFPSEMVHKYSENTLFLTNNLPQEIALLSLPQ